jgi:Subtilase family
LLRNNTLSPATTTTLSPTVNQTQPSISNDGRYIALIRRVAVTNNYLVTLYNRTANTYSNIRQATSVLEHPSASNYGEKVAWLEKVGSSNRINVRDIQAAITTQILSTTNVLNHPHLAADGNYLTFAQQVSGKFAVYIRNLTTNQQVVAVTSSVNNTAPYWQFPAPVTQLLGSPTSPAAVAVPRIEFTPKARDYTTNHPTLAGSYISYNTILLAFKLNTTVQQANTILDQIGAEIVGGLPGAAGQVEGALIVRVANTTHQQMINMLATLKSNLSVMVAVQDVLLEESSVPQPNGNNPAGWTWQTTPSTSNWNLERIRTPQMWNLNAALQKENKIVQTAILDTGFVTHPDLQIATSLGTRDHGTQVAGVLGATFNNQLGIDGVNPFVELLPTQTDATLGTNVAGRRSGGQIILNDFYTIVGVRKVINISLDYNWYLRSVDTNANTQNSIDARTIASEQGLYVALVLGSLFRPLPLASQPLMAVSAGNDNFVTFPTLQTARWSSPFTNAAIEYSQPNIIVVEGISDQTPVGRFSQGTQVVLSLHQHRILRQLVLVVLMSLFLEHPLRPRTSPVLLVICLILTLH